MTPSIDAYAGKRLIYLMGASGSGKDTLLRHLRAALQPNEPVLVAHRYITRPSGADESSIPLSEAEFKHRIELGCFALHWHSHGLYYGIGIEIDSWLTNKAVVIINGSRRYLATAYERYPQLHAIEVTAEPEILAKRLAQRGRESSEQIQARLKKAQESYPIPNKCNVTALSNNTQPEEAAQRLHHTVQYLLTR